MSGRRALYVGLVIACSLALLVQAGSFSSMSAGRDARVGVVSDDDAYLGVSARGPASLSAAGDADSGHGNDCDGVDDDNPGRSGKRVNAGGSRDVNVTVLVRNQFADPMDVTVEVGSRTKSRYVEDGNEVPFEFENVSSSSAVVVDAEGPDFSADVRRALCA
ncbi:hypothetical protein ACFQJD_03285 [Haloplanus sp. GCM10025708]|uniref:hypothetical protein n=1 Tax=Haloferacaceae TaxID=1644056 RepID=UPI00361A3ADA